MGVGLTIPIRNGRLALGEQEEARLRELRTAVGAQCTPGLARPHESSQGPGKASTSMSTETMEDLATWW